MKRLTKAITAIFRTAVFAGAVYVFVKLMEGTSPTIQILVSFFFIMLILSYIENNLLETIQELEWRIQDLEVRLNSDNDYYDDQWPS